jgi:hypothetical protein
MMIHVINDGPTDFTLCQWQITFKPTTQARNVHDYWATAVAGSLRIHYLVHDTMNYDSAGDSTKREVSVSVPLSDLLPLQKKDRNRVGCADGSAPSNDYCGDGTEPQKIYSKSGH